jgi:hypothetical protein
VSAGIFDSLANKAASTVGKKGAGWIQSGVDSIRKKLPTGDDPELVAVRATAEYGLATLERNKDLFGRLGEDGTTAFMGFLAMGDKARAGKVVTDRLAYLRLSAGWDELDATVDAAADRTLRAKRDQDAAIALIKDVGSVAASKLLPFLLMTLTAA